MDLLRLKALEILEGLAEPKLPDRPWDAPWFWSTCAVASQNGHAAPREDVDIDVDPSPETPTEKVKKRSRERTRENVRRPPPKRLRS